MMPMEPLDLTPLNAINRIIRGASIKGVMMTLGGDRPRMAIVTDRTDPDSGQVLLLVIEGVERAELMVGVLTAITGREEGQ